MKPVNIYFGVSFDRIKWIVKALTAVCKGDPLPSLVDPELTEDPKYVAQANEEFSAMREREAEMKREAAWNKENGVKPFRDVPEGSEDPGERKGQSPEPLRPKMKTTAVRSGSVNWKKEAEKSKPDVSHMKGEAEEPKLDGGPLKRNTGLPKRDICPVTRTRIALSAHWGAAFGPREIRIPECCPGGIAGRQLPPEAFIR
ncbi:MAG: hypothetical protein LBR80_09710 [Deltaproteobacteria bacterium]|nr:hypothetical protein [Deltaproteobacteria bacterium]